MNQVKAFDQLFDVIVALLLQEDMLAEDSAEAEGVVPTDNDGAEASQVDKYLRQAQLLGYSSSLNSCCIPHKVSRHDQR